MGLGLGLGCCGGHRDGELALLHHADGEDDPAHLGLGLGLGLGVRVSRSGTLRRAASCTIRMVVVLPTKLSGCSWKQA